MKGLLNLVADGIDRIISADAEQWLGFIGLIIIIGSTTIALTAITADHKVRCYYPSTISTSAGLAYKVISDIDWAEDRTAFSSSDPKETSAFMEGLLQCAAKQEKN